MKNPITIIQKKPFPDITGEQMHMLIEMCIQKISEKEKSLKNVY